MKIIVKYYSIYRDLLKKTEETLEMKEDSKVFDVFEGVMKENPQKNSLLNITRFAVNSEFSSVDHSLKDGDEVVFIPPVAGG